MVEALMATWELVDSENFDEYMKAIGIGHAVREVSNLLKPSTEISRDGDHLVLKFISPYVTHIITCKLGEEFDETTQDGRQVKSLVTVQGQKIHYVQKWEGRECSSDREVIDGMLVMTLRCGDVKSVRTFKKVS